MNLIGPKSIASKLHLIVKILFFMQIARVVLMAIAPILPSSVHQYLSFDVQSGPLELGFDVFRGSEARWWIWGMELVSRTCHLVVLYLLMRILEPAGIGEPFHLKIPSRLRMMGCAVIVSALLRTVFCAQLLRLGLRPEPGVWISWAIDFDAIFMGILLVVLAEVFRRGYALKAESELTV